MQQVDINQITDIKELKSMIADEFIVRENARSTEANANNNIQIINARIAQVERENTDATEKAKQKESE